MKIDARQISEEGVTLTEDFNPDSLELNTDLIKFLSPVKAKADIRKSYNAVSITLALSSQISISCGRCLKEERKDFNRRIELHFALDKSNPIIELDPEIREEIILGYPIKPLCNVDCKGLCPKCGMNLNEGGCNCGTT